jgi:hypothetical protein
MTQMVEHLPSKHEALSSHQERKEREKRRLDER